MNSMTGFGRSCFRHEQFNIILEVSSVNKRHFEAVCGLPKEWQSLERVLLERARGKIQRGRLRIHVRPEEASVQNSSNDWLEKNLAADLDKLEAFAKSRGIPFEPDAHLITRLASSRRSESGLPSADAVEPGLLKAVDKALEALVAMRAEEGKRLSEDLFERIRRLETFAADIETSAKGTADEWRDRLLERLRKADLSIDLDDERVLKEFTLFADKADISEEITRLRSHCIQFRESLESKDAIGRKLEFVLQEISRELNTLCAKASRPETNRLGLDARNEVEKLREQVLNLE